MRGVSRQVLADYKSQIDSAIAVEQDLLTKYQQAVDAQAAKVAQMQAEADEVQSDIDDEINNNAEPRGPVARSASKDKGS